MDGWSPYQMDIQIGLQLKGRISLFFPLLFVFKLGEIPFEFNRSPDFTLLSRSGPQKVFKF